MKKYFAVLSMAGLLFTSASAFSQTNQEKVNVKMILEEENGVKVLTITGEKDGKASETVYRGAKAQAKLDEFKNQGNEVILNEFVADDGRLLYNVIIKKANTSAK